MNAALLHQQAVSLSKTYKRSESELLGILSEMQKSEAIRELKYPNLFVYCVQALGLSEAQAGYFSKVANKSLDVPALQQAIDNGTISLSQARRVVAVITPQNSLEWIEKASTLPQRELKRQVTVANPKAVIREKIRPMAPQRSELRVGISVELERKLQRIREVLAQNKKHSVTFEEALGEMAELFLKHKDPVEKAKRARPVKSGSSERLTAAARHEVNRRDQGKCQATLPNGKPCNSAFWVEQHHIKPKSYGGPNTPANLITLCSQHHKMQHRTEPRQFGRMRLPDLRSERSDSMICRKPRSGAATISVNE